MTVGRLVQSVQRLDGPGIESRWGRDFPHLSRSALGPTNILYTGCRVFPVGKDRQGRDADPSLPSSAVVMKEYSYTSTPPMGRTACAEPQCLYKGALYFFLYMTHGNENISGPKYNPISRMINEQRAEESMWKEAVVPQYKARFLRISTRSMSIVCSPVVIRTSHSSNIDHKS